MKHLAFLVIAATTLLLAGCNNTSKSTSTASAETSNIITDSVADTTATLSTETPVPASPEVAGELAKAVNQEHGDADAEYSYDAATNTVKIIKQVEVPANQAEEDFAGALVEKDVPEFIAQFKNSTKPSDITIKSKGATITMSYVNKATGDEIIQFDITPDDLK